MSHPKIVSFVYSAKRTPPTLPVALESIRAAGFDPCMLFEPEVLIEPYSGPGTQIAQVTRHAGPYGLLKMGLSLTLQEADYVVAFQDDCTVARGTADWLADQINLDTRLKHAGAISLYSAQALTDGIDAVGWWKVEEYDLPRRAYGAVALCFPAESARLLLASKFEYCPVAANRGKGLHADLNVGCHCLHSRRPWMFHTPSLCQHTGAVSVAHPGASLSSFRRASEVVSDVSEISGWKPRSVCKQQ